MRKLLLLFSQGSLNAARGLFLVCLVGIPWLWGGTREWTVTWLVVALYGVAGFWLVGRIAQYGTPRRGSPWGISPLLLVLVLMAAAFGWGMTWNATSYLDPLFLKFIPIASSATSKLPGTVDEETSQIAMTRICALLLALLFSSYLAARPKWRQILLVSLCGTAIPLAVIGIAQRITSLPLLFWELDRFDATSFGFYRYHGNAASFLNLAWPICAALAVEAFQRKDAILARAVWLPGAIILLTGIGVNTSRGGHLVTLILLVMAPLFAFEALRQSALGRHPTGRRHWILPLLVGIVVLAGLLALIGNQNSIQRWGAFFTNDSSQTIRIWMVKTCIEIAQDRPWFGFGPGTFMIVFPFYIQSFGIELYEAWDYAHSDYAQTLVEWGVLGGLLWAGMLFGGILRGSRRVFRRNSPLVPSPDRPNRYDLSSPQSRPSRERIDSSKSAASTTLQDAAICLSLIGVAIHAAFDFPLQISSIQLITAVLLGCAWRPVGPG